VTENTTRIVKDEYEMSLKAGIYYYPALVINNYTVVRGTLSADYMFTMLCRAYNETPYVCISGDTNSKGISFGSVFLILLIVSVLAAGVIYYCNKKSKKELQQ